MAGAKKNKKKHETHKKCIQDLVVKFEGMRPLTRCRRRWLDKIILKKIEYQTVDWIHLAQDRVQ
jgi:hypothetical protein